MTIIISPAWHALFTSDAETFGLSNVYKYKHVISTQIMATNNNTGASPAQQQQSSEPRQVSKAVRITIDISHSIVMVLSVLLIVYISYDTFDNIPFLQNHSYMVFQFWVCMVFLADFFLELFLVHDKKGYLKDRWFFFLVSIPYLNIINQMPGLELSEHVLYFIRFVPLVRGGYSLSMVVGYISRNRALSILAQYVVILLTIVYIASLIFYYEEHNVNPNVADYWDSLYWACMNVTTVGCYFSAVTPAGKVISVILPTAGMLMLPLFTVWVIDSVKQFNVKMGSVFGEHKSERPSE